MFDFSLITVFGIVLAGFLALFKWVMNGVLFNEGRSSEGDFWKVMIVFALAVCTPIAFYLWKFGKSSFSSAPENWGVAGDFFGGILNPIFSFASFIALLYTIRIQSREIELTRKEMAESIDSQKKLVEQQKETIESSRANEKTSLIISMLSEQIREMDEFLYKRINTEDFLQKQFCLWDLFVEAKRRASTLTWQYGNEKVDYESVVKEFRNLLITGVPDHEDMLNHAIYSINLKFKYCVFNLRELHEDHRIERFYSRSMSIQVFKHVAILEAAECLSFGEHEFIDMKGFYASEGIGSMELNF